MRSPNLYSRDELPKTEIHCLFLQRTPGGKPHLTNVGMLTVEGKYIEYEMEIKQKSITWFVAQRIRELFRPYKFTRESAVIISDSISAREPLYMYIRFIRQQLQFNLNVVSVDRIVKRVAYFHHLKTKTGVKVDKKYLNRLWDWLVKKNKCPWISSAYDFALKNMSDYRAREKKVLRVGIYYMLAKRHRQDIQYNKSLQAKQFSEDREFESS